MAWNVIVTYLKKESSNNNNNNSSSIKDNDISSFSSSTCSGDSLEGSFNPQQNFGHKMKFATCDFRKRNSRLFPFLLEPGKFGGSIESIDAISANNPNKVLTRSGSIRISDSPLHRGSQFGSPAFRRKKMKTRSELQLSHSSDVSPNFDGSKVRKSGLPLPKTTNNMVSKKNDNSPRPKRPNSLTRSLSKNSPASSPRNSMYKETLMGNFQKSENIPNSTVVQPDLNAKKAAGLSNNNNNLSGRREEGKDINGSSSTCKFASTPSSKPETLPKPVSSSSGKGNRSRIPTSPTSVSNNNNSPSKTLPNSPQNTPLRNIKNSNHLNARSRSPKSSNPHHTSKKIHKPGQIPSYLNKSTPSLVHNTSSNNNSQVTLRNSGRSSKSRPVSRDFEAPTSSNGGHRQSFKPLAPTAKFRSDGEISICEYSPIKSNSNDNNNDSSSFPASLDPKSTNVSSNNKVSSKHEGRDVAEHARARRPRVISSSNSSQNNRNVGKNSPLISKFPASASKSAAKSSERHIIPPHTNNSFLSCEAKKEEKDSRCYIFKPKNLAIRKGEARRETQSRKNVSSGFATTTTNSPSSEVQCWPFLQPSLENPDQPVKPSASNLVRSNSFFKSRSKSLTFFQRLGSLRRSFNNKNCSHRVSHKVFAKDPDDPDHVFFRGFSGKRREEVVGAVHEVGLVVPQEPRLHLLRRKRPQRGLRRTYSLTDAHFIAQAMYEEDRVLIEELYPDFLSSQTPVHSRKRESVHSKPWNDPSSPSIANSNTREVNICQKELEKKTDEENSSAPFLSGQQNNRKQRNLDNFAGANPVSRLHSCAKNRSEQLRSPHGKEFENERGKFVGLRGGGGGDNRLQDSVTFSSPVMFVKQSSDLQKRGTGSFIHRSESHNNREDHGYIYGSSPRRVTKVSLVDSNLTPTPVMANADLKRPNTFKQELSPVISPWNSHQNGRPGSTSSNASSSGTNSSNDLENDQEYPNPQQHPFAQRTQLHYMNKQLQNRQALSNSLFNSKSGSHGRCNDVSITTSKLGGGGVTLSPSSFNSSHELNFSLNNGRFHRSESADNGKTEDKYYHKKHSAPGLFLDSHQDLECDNGSGFDRLNLDDSFRKILAKAGNSLSQAESILSNLRAESNAIPLKEDVEHPREERGGSDDEEDDSSGPASLGSDIETNIRRLEKTQAKINAALETFRNVQALSNSDLRSDNKSSINSNFVAKSSFNSLPFHALPHVTKNVDSNDPNSKCRTAPAKLEGSNEECQSKLTLKTSQSYDYSCSPPNNTSNSNNTKVKKTSLFRRHSFNSTPNKEMVNSSNETSETLSREDSNSWYITNPDRVHSRSSAGLDQDTYSFSDSEGGFLPLRSRLKGILGSFGKGKKKVARPVISDRNQVENSQHSSPILKATLGEFTRQIENLSSRNNQEDGNYNNRYLYRRHQYEDRSQNAKSVILRKKRELIKNDSIDTTSSYNGCNSNRNSVISAQSISSESYENDHSEEENTKVNSDSSPRSATAEHGASLEARQEKKLFYIAREILTSERVFVDILRLINVEFRDFVQKARRESKSGIMPDSDFSRIFSNLPELQTLNEDLLQDFEARIANWHRLKKIADVIVKKGPFLKLYTTYIREFSSVNYHFDECCKRYPKFEKLVLEFEKKERCRHLKLKHFMLKPVQRLPQYKLLLEDYLKHLDQESPDFDDTTIALRIVSDAAEHANDTIKQGDQFRKMLKLQSRLGDMELIKPGRELIREGELQKISRKGVGPRYFVLLSDCLLYCTYAGSWSGDTTSLRVTYKIPLTTLQVRFPNAEDYQNEFNITSPIRSCTLRANSVNERNDWLEALNSAIEEHVSRKATFCAASGSDLLTPAEACKIGNSAPVWIPDRRVTMCQQCAIEFSVLVRRHHCRACGKVVCSTCSGNKAPLRYRDFESARVCDACFDFLQQELAAQENLRMKFKKRDAPKHANGRYVPQRLKVSANDDGSQICGYLKRKQKNGKWKRMWFVLKDNVIYEYKASEDTVATDTHPILGYDLDIMSERKDEIYEGEYANLVFLLSHPGGETLVFCAENECLCDKWMGSIRDAIKLDPST